MLSKMGVSARKDAWGRLTWVVECAVLLVVSRKYMEIQYWADKKMSCSKYLRYDMTCFNAPSILSYMPGKRMSQTASNREVGEHLCFLLCFFGLTCFFCWYQFFGIFGDDDPQFHDHIFSIGPWLAASGLHSIQRREGHTFRGVLGGSGSGAKPLILQHMEVS